MSLFAANLNLSLTRVRGILRAEPRILSTVAALAVVLFLMLWAPGVGHYLLTDGYHQPPPRYGPALYILASEYLLPALYTYGLAFLVAGTAGYLVERTQGAPLYSPERGIERYGLRYAHQLLGMFIIATIVIFIFALMLDPPRPGADGTMLPAPPPAPAVSLLLIIVQLAGQLYLVLWTLELVRGRGWTKAGFAAAAEGLKKAEVLLVGFGYLAFEIVAMVATNVVLEPAEVATPVTAMPFALLLVLARAALLPFVLLLFIQWQPATAELPAGLPPAENPLAACPGDAPALPLAESAPASGKKRKRDRKRR